MDYVKPELLIVTAVFASVTQGIVVAGLSTYIHQIIKQAGKEE